MGPRESIDPTAAEFLRQGLDDWVSMINAHDIAYMDWGLPLGKSPEEVREYTLRNVRWLAENGYVDIGEIGNGFVKWPGSLDDVMARLSTLYTGKTETSQEWHPWGYACWIANTEKGDALAETLLETE